MTGVKREQSYRELIENTNNLIMLRADAIRTRNRQANWLLILSLLIGMVVASNVIASFRGYPIWGSGFVVFTGTIMLMTVWFQGLTDKYDVRQYAGELAGDLIMSLAATQARRLTVKHGQKTEEPRLEQCLTVIRIGKEQQGLFSVATRIAEFRSREIGKPQIKTGWLPRITPISKEYCYTKEDIRDLVMAMNQSIHLVDTYKSIFELIDVALPTMTEEKKNG